MTPPNSPLTSCPPPPLAQPPSSIYRTVICMFWECESWSPLWLSASLRMYRLCLSLCLCGYVVVTLDCACCMLFYISVYIVIIFKKKKMFFKTHIFQLRRFADYIDMILLTILLYDADYCPGRMYLRSLSIMDTFWRPLYLVLFFFQNTENIFQTLAFHSLRLQVLMSFWVLNY